MIEVEDLKYQVWRLHEGEFNCFVEVPADYDGPHLDNGTVTEEFMDELLTAFKEQKKLHQKYAYQVLLTI